MCFSSFVHHVLSKICQYDQKHTLFFSNFAHFCPPKRCTGVHCLVLKNNPNYVNFLRGWYLTSNTSGPLPRNAVYRLQLVLDKLRKDMQKRVFRGVFSHLKNICLEFVLKVLLWGWYPAWNKSGIPLCSTIWTKWGWNANWYHSRMAHFLTDLYYPIKEIVSDSNNTF